MINIQKKLYLEDTHTQYPFFAQHSKNEGTDDGTNNETHESNCKDSTITVEEDVSMMVHG